MIYAPPSKIKVPNSSDYMLSSGFDNKAYLKAEKEYIEAIRKLCEENYSGKYVGKIARFPVADGYAEYMIASLRPLKVIHLPIGDAYRYPYAERLHSKDFKATVDSQEAMERIFSKV